METEDCFVRKGDHYMLCDGNRTRVRWVLDGMIASTHTREWAQYFLEDHPDEWPSLEIVTVRQAREDAEREKAGFLDRDWYEAFEAALEDRFEIGKPKNLALARLHGRQYQIRGYPAEYAAEEAGKHRNLARKGVTLG